MDFFNINTDKIVKFKHTYYFCLGGLMAGGAVSQPGPSGSLTHV